MGKPVRPVKLWKNGRQRFNSFICWNYKAYKAYNCTSRLKIHLLRELGLCTVYCTLFTVHCSCTLHTEHCSYTLYTVHCSCTLHNCGVSC